MLRGRKKWEYISEQKIKRSNARDTSGGINENTGRIKPTEQQKAASNQDKTTQTAASVE
jgi:hypothetical protein